MDIDKVLLTIGVVFLNVLLVIIAVTPPAHSYEISIYAAYPVYFWIFALCAISIGVIILIRNAFLTSLRSKWYLSGIILVLCVNLIIILLPLFRGYFISSMGDEISHLGMVKDIELTGKIGTIDMYPVSHILVFQMSSITGVDSHIITKLIPSIFYLLYIFGLFLLSYNISNSIRTVLLVIAFGSPLLFTYFNYLFLPTHLLLYLVPFLLFLFLRNQGSVNGYLVVLLLFIVILPLIHPLGSLFVVGIFILLYLSKLVVRLLFRKRVDFLFETYQCHFSPLAVASIIFIILFGWFSNFSIFQKSITSAFDWFINGVGVPPMEIMAGQIQTSGFSLIQFIELFIRNYGHDLIFSILSLIVLVLILKYIIIKKLVFTFWGLYFGFVFLFFSLFYLSTLFGDFIVTGRSIRIFCWALVASILLNGIFFHRWIFSLSHKTKIMLSALITFVIILSAFIGLFSVFPSPHIKTANPQVTYGNWLGTKWFFSYKSPLQTLCFSQLPSRSSHAIFGTSLPKPFTVGDFSIVPPRLGYDNSISISDSCSANSYLFINLSDRVAKSTLWPDIGLYTVADLNRLNSDRGIGLLYCNGETEIWEIFSLKNE